MSDVDRYQDQLAAVDAAIAKDPGNPEWTKLRADLLEVIQLKQQLSQIGVFKQTIDIASLRLDTLDKTSERLEAMSYNEDLRRDTDGWVPYTLLRKGSSWELQPP